MIDILFVVPSFSPQLKEESIGTLLLAKIAMAANYNVRVLRYWEVTGVFEEYSYFKEKLIDRVLSFEPRIVSFYSTLPGIYPIHVTVEKILDYIFSMGGNLNKLDVYCTHDFNIALLLQYLFPLINTQEMIIENWPDPLEGVFMWGKRNDFYCCWKDKISHHSLPFK